MRLPTVFCLVVALAAQPVLAGPHSGGFIAHPFNGSTAPVTKDGVTTLQIKPTECSTVDYGDGRGESDCKNGNIRSNIVADDNGEKVGESYEYTLDLRLDPAFAYEGYQNGELFDVYLPNHWDSALRLVSWEGNLLHNFIYRLSADRRRGITFAGETCQSADKIGEWLGFSLRVKWTNDDRGWVEARCDGRVVYLAENIISTAAPHCYPRNQCEPGKLKQPRAIRFIVGPVMEGSGHTWKRQGLDSPFIDFQPITMQARNVSVTPGVELYGPEEKAQIVTLQEALNDLGCNVGAADGVAGRKTREAALVCRSFPDEQLPREFNVATLPTFVTLYSSPAAKDLPPGAPRAPLLNVRASELGTEIAPDGTVLATFVARVDGAEGLTPKPFEFMIIAGYERAENRFQPFNIQLQEGIPAAKSAAVAACKGQWTEDHGDAGVFVVLQFERQGPDKYVAPGRDCIIKALPAGQAAQMAFLADHFNDLASAIVANGVEWISNEGLKAFLPLVANGEVTIGQ